MGFIITIGNAEPWHEKIDNELKAGWSVKIYNNTFAPNLPNDDCTKQSNCRRPSYTSWRDFLDKTNLIYWFEDKLNEKDLSCTILTQKDLEDTKESLNKWQKNAILPPGFEKENYNGPSKYDPILGRLIWLNWWTEWSLKNCENPAIEIIR